MLKWIAAAGDLWIQHSKGIRQSVARQMMIRDDCVYSRIVQLFNLFYCSDAVVNCDDKAGTLADDLLNSF